MRRDTWHSDECNAKPSIVETKFLLFQTKIASRVVIELIDLSVSVIKRGSQAFDTVYGVELCFQQGHATPNACFTV